MHISLSRRTQTLSIVIVFTLAFLLVLLRTAWISDDAVITLRTVLNFLNGYGARFNIDERVQAYTHPLWFLLLSGTALITKNVFTAAYWLPIVTSLAVAVLLLGLGRDNPRGLLIAGAAMLLSKAFVDFSTSGLENPLSHLLILGAFICCADALAREGRAQASLNGFFICAALLYLNRPDLIAMLVPMVGLVIFANRHTPRNLVLPLLLGALPVAVWTAFSLYYYGFPFPNTAYAKLGTGIEFGDRFAQGVKYLRHSIRKDPLTIFIIAMGVTTGLLNGGIRRALAVGIGLYLFYTLSIGGDFMEGRFFTAPFLAALIILVHQSYSRRQCIVVFGIVLLLGLVFPKTPTIASGSSYSNEVIARNGIADERGFYYQRTGLFKFDTEPFGKMEWRDIPPRRSMVLCGGLGLNSIFAGPSVHLIDECALADPLLSRLPAKQLDNWRVGHFVRQLPTDYVYSVETDSNQLTDESLARVYDSIRSITRDSLNSSARLSEIVRFNVKGMGDIDLTAYRNGFVPRISRNRQTSLSALDKEVPDGTHFAASDNIVFESILEIDLEGERSFDTLDIAVDNNDRYIVEAYVHGNWQEIFRIEPVYSHGMVGHVLHHPDGPVTTNRLRLLAIEGDGLYSLGRLQLAIQD